MQESTTRTPMGAAGDRKRLHEVSRLEALSDGVFAFALTLLVVSLEVPKTFDQLRANVRGFLAFGFCFAILVQIWWEHNKFFRRFGLQDPTTVVLNSVVLFVVLFFVYPLKFLFLSFVEVFFGIKGGIQWGPEDLAALFAIYGMGYIAVFGSILLLYRHALKQRAELGLEELELFDAREAMGALGIHVGIATLSVLCAVTGVGIRFALPGWLYALLGPLFGLFGWWTGRRREALERRLQSAAALAPAAE